jgi:serine/threonine protein kinase
VAQELPLVKIGGKVQEGVAMALAPGLKLGPYEVVTPLGAGGMGEVYRARDSRLGREVALKVLPEDRAGDPDREARLEQEARAAGGLNHPNLLTVHDIGRIDGVTFMVTELVEGESMREWIARGPIPVRRAVEIAAQLADGLAVAHAAGIVHRDLKPENIMLARNGRPKILDFGLAKPVFKSVDQSDAIDTLSLTREGVTVGTPGYMSPEQVRAVPADHRSDLFTLGAVLYEMLAGQRAFECPTWVETLNAILNSDPPELATSVPPAVRQAVQHCLEKEPENRFQSASDLAFALRHVTGDSLEAPRNPTRRKLTLKPRPLLWLMAVAIGPLAGALAMRLFSVETEAVEEHVHFTPFATDGEMEAFPRFSPDGKSIAYSKALQIFVRPLEAAAPTQLTQGTLQAQNAFWSADGAYIYFTSNYELNPGLWRVSSAGGKPSPILEKARYPVLSPNGTTVVFSRADTQGHWRLFSSSPPGAEPKPLPDSPLQNTARIPRSRAFAPDGSKLIVSLEREVWLLPFPSGTPRRMTHLEPSSDTWWFPDSRHVMLLVGGIEGGFRLALADTEGTARRSILRGPQVVISGDLRPDGKQFVYSVGSPNWDIVEFGVDGRRRGNLVATSRMEFAGRWSRQGDRLAYLTNARGPLELWIRDADGHKSAPLATGKSLGRNTQDLQFSPDGLRLSYATGNRVWVVSSHGGAPVQVYSSPPGTFLNVSWSPDSELLAVCDGFHFVKVPSTGGAPTIVKETPARVCNWSPDGRWIVYDTPGGDHIMTPDGSKDRLLDNRKIWAPCDFTSDSRTYVCAESQEPGGVNLVTRAIPSGNVIRTVPLELDRSLGIIRLSMHPDGTRFAASVGKIDYDLWMVDGFDQPATGLSRLWHHWMTPK